MIININNLQISQIEFTNSNLIHDKGLVILKKCLHDMYLKHLVEMLF